MRRAWNAKLGTFVATFDGDTLDASLLRMNELFFVNDDDPRFAATVRAIGKELKRGNFVFRYMTPDDFGTHYNYGIALIELIIVTSHCHRPSD